MRLGRCEGGEALKTLYIYGPPASGKSTLARRLAREFGRMAVDLDEEIVRRVGMSIPDYFAANGEVAFRKVESEILREVDAPVVALGGGTLLDGANRDYAESRGMVVVLDVDDETIARRIESEAGSRPLGNRLDERRAHYASFVHHADADTKIMLPRLLRGAIKPPPSKSHLHRILMADFLAGGECPAADASDCADIAATKRCIKALTEGRDELDVGESGSTLRFFAPVAAALGAKVRFIRHGRLAERPMIEYQTLEPGVHELRGDVSSQFATGLLFALPLLKGDSEIRFSTPLQSRGYVDMTLDVLRAYGIAVEETCCGFKVPGGQRYVRPAGGAVKPEGDWSAAAFWFAANALGSAVKIEGLNAGSRQPDRAVESLMAEVKRGGTIDVSGCPDCYPALAAVNHALGCGARFVGTERLRLKESDRIAAMDAVFADSCDVDTRNDHRIAMAAAVLSTVAEGPVLIHGASCVAKSYPGFWQEFKMNLYCVTGWPLLKTRSPEIHNAAYAAAGRKAEMVSHPAETIEDALRFSEIAGVKGMAVTIPHKESIMRYLDCIDEAAQEIGAVNTVVFGEDGKSGYNTDEPGFGEAICAFVGRDSLDGLKVALLGAGGAAKAVGCALERLGAAAVEVFHRRPLTSGFDLIVNATPVDPVPEYEFTGREMVYDLRYEPPETPLMARARAAGCRVENGFSMLEAQARLQRKLFFGEDAI